MSFRETWHQLRSKGTWYSIWVAVVLVGGTYLGHLTAQWDGLVSLRYTIYGFQTRNSWRRNYAKFTSIVLIDDDAYWKGGLQGRRPIKRNHLARLLRVVDSAQPKVIALDFDLRSPIPDGSLIKSPDYQSETDELPNAIREVSRQRPVVLPAAFAGKSRRTNQPIVVASAASPKPARCRAMFSELSDYLDEDLDASLCEELEKHLDSCAPCKTFLSSFEAIIRECRKTPVASLDRKRAAKLRRESLARYEKLFAGRRRRQNA